MLSDAPYVRIFVSRRANKEPIVGGETRGHDGLLGIAQHCLLEACASVPQFNHRIRARGDQQ